MVVPMPIVKLAAAMLHLLASECMAIAVTSELENTQGAGSHLRAIAGVVPDWKLHLALDDPAAPHRSSGHDDMSISAAIHVPPAFGPLDTPYESLHSAASNYGIDIASLGAPLSPKTQSNGAQPVRTGTRAFETTAAQDNQRCPILTLPPSVLSRQDDPVWWKFRKTGRWTDMHGASLATWSQPPFACDSLSIWHWDGRLAFRVQAVDEDQLFKTHGWKARVQRSRPEKVRSVMLLLDCVGQLLFVVFLSTHEPATIDVFDPAGYLIALSLDDSTVAKSQFADTQLNRLATAESPGSWTDFKKSALPYSMTFDLGGYANSSRLLDSDHRWVLLATFQARALFQAQGGGRPSWDMLVTVLAGTTTVLFVALLVSGCFLLYRLIYPEERTPEKQNAFFTTAPVAYRKAHRPM